MSRTAIGMVETVGLLAAYEAADVAVKSANVKLVGYEKSSGGMVVIKFSGDIGAVKSAVDAAVTAASRLGKVFSSNVIPRPHQDIDKKMIFTDDTVGYQKYKSPAERSEKKSEESEEITENKGETEEEGKTAESINLEFEAEEEFDSEVEAVESETDKEADKVTEIEEDQESQAEREETEKDEEDICNLCGDPDCPRRKGELRTDCIHYDEIIDEDE